MNPPPHPPQGPFPGLGAPPDDLPPDIPVFPVDRAEVRGHHLTMGHSIISVDGLGKKYLLSHRMREPYAALRDVMVEKVKGLGRRILRPFSPGPSRGSDPDREEFWALRGVSVDVYPGNHGGIIGRYRAGKSTRPKIRVMFGSRGPDGLSLLFKTIEATDFLVTGSDEEVGLKGELADSLDGQFAPLLLPCAWELPDGRTVSVNPFQQVNR